MNSSRPSRAITSVARRAPRSAAAAERAHAVAEVHRGDAEGVLVAPGPLDLRGRGLVERAGVAHARDVVGARQAAFAREGFAEGQGDADEGRDRGQSKTQ